MFGSTQKCSFVAAIEESWMAVYTKPRNEKKVTERLNKMGIENYLPLIEQKRKWSDRYKTVRVPAISSYVFVRVEENQRLQVLKDPGVLNFVFWLGKPALVSNEEINRMKYVLKEAGSFYEICVQHFKPGEDVEIIDGVFIGNEASVIEQGTKEIVLLLKELGVKIKLTPLSVNRIKKS